MTPDLFPGGVSLWKEVFVLGTLQQMLPSAVTGGDVPCRGQGGFSCRSTSLLKPLSLELLWTGRC